ncbi:TMEM54 isoform 3 [Pan troglodytes]|uniref:TMEM54 isoform 3 n=5 Tax=Homininae TaxID=207598 RepID=A0A6D2WA48_PANTR|nr:transmembrane protein 54 isoform 5 [Homo sapiens]PNI20332.1 TMEM54 isoform 3 [Pan troglodytes]AAH23260.1 TMEM54 protein [Homo sapiens]EAX07493.1 transmembrane protein 54, isoform CRA_b [Homo sapiens]KAI2516146.1 transmembrane protein 54 [Homo sapiens]KAI4079703.1 transmembrane protein 54 [Homo sapiens]|eukprot:NP_001316654.1 transmembrane protein 54 isoform 5 [Homo sapiens]
MCLRLGGLSVGDFRKVLMKTGLVLVVLGHVSFITAALFHGTVLRYVGTPQDAVALQYCVVNILSVTSAIVGKALLAACTFGSSELLALAPDCPFDPTRIYSSSLCLWGIALVLCVAENVFAVRCAQLTHQLLELRPWWGKSSHHMMRENPELVEGRDLLSCTSSEPLTL